MLRTDGRILSDTLAQVRALVQCVFITLLVSIPGGLHAQSYVYQWAWMDGNDAQDTSGAPFGWPGIYGELGKFSKADIPSARERAAHWTDKRGRLWLYGGFGSDSTTNYGDLDDLWVFDPSLGARGEWAWMGGDDKVNCTGCGRPGVYGKQGEFAATNNPGSRTDATAWTDREGKLWLFGGGYTKVIDSGNELIGISLNDLWEFDPTKGTSGEWAWVGGSKSLPSVCIPSSCGRPGVYGVQGEFAAENMPGARSEAAGVVDSAGNLWLFGGGGTDANGTHGSLNDLWEFDPTKGTSGEWAWITGSSTVPSIAAGRPGVYGEEGTFAAANTPGGRGQSNMWLDPKGHLWIFGGFGLGPTGNGEDLNDLWEFDPSKGVNGEWAWMAGSIKLGANDWVPGVYSTEGDFGPSNTPGGRYGAQSWTGSDGTIWLLGGQGHDSVGTMGDMNDLWRFNPARGAYGEWAWVGGSSTLPTKNSTGQPGSFGILGQFAEANVPGGRDSGAVWLDLDGNVWMYGGGGLYSVTYQGGLLDDLWEYKRLITQKIVFGDVPGSITYSTSPITLSATGGGSGKPVVFSVVSGPAKTGGTHGSVLTLTDAGTVVVAANQAGTSEYAAAPQMTHKIVVKPAGTVATPTIKPGTGTYESTQMVTITDSTAGATIYYTSDGSTPSATHGTQYKTAFSVGTSETVKAIGVLAGYTSSKIAAASYTIQ